MSVTWKYTPPTIDLAARVREATPLATRAAADHLLATSRPLVPEDTGALKASGRVEQDGTAAQVIYQAVAEDGYDYAAIQHERMDYHHEHGSAKYLEIPMRTEAAEMAVVARDVLIENVMW